MQKEMMLITSSWNNYKTFRLVPISNNSTYAEGIFDSERKVLVLMSRQMGEQFRMVPRLSEDGEMMKSKGPRSNGKTYKEERKVITGPIEYYITVESEVREILNVLANNSETFDFESYLKSEKPVPVEAGSALSE